MSFDPREHFDAVAEEWDRAVDAPDVRGHWWRMRIERAFRLLGEPAGTVLDIGCGPGRLLAMLAERGWDATGIDTAPGVVELARRRAPAANIVDGDAEALPFEDASFDAVVLFGLLQWVDAEKALREAVRVVRPGGRAVIGTRYGDAPARRWERRVSWPASQAVRRMLPGKQPQDPRRFPPITPVESREGLERVGFAVEHEERFACAVLVYPFGRLAPRLAYRAAVAAERSARLRRVFATQRLFVARRR